VASNLRYSHLPVLDRAAADHSIALEAKTLTTDGPTELTEPAM
jgi:hypothetical protein